MSNKRSDYASLFVVSINVQNCHSDTLEAHWPHSIMSSDVSIQSFLETSLSAQCATIMRDLWVDFCTHFGPVCSTLEIIQLGEKIDVDMKTAWLCNNFSHISPSHCINL